MPFREKEWEEREIQAETRGCEGMHCLLQSWAMPLVRRFQAVLTPTGVAGGSVPYIPSEGGAPQ